MANFGEESSELTTASVLKRNIAWDTYLTARLITDHDLQLIRRYDKKNPEIQQDLLQEVSYVQETHKLVSLSMTLMLGQVVFPDHWSGARPQLSRNPVRTTSGNSLWEMQL